MYNKIFYYSMFLTSTISSIHLKNMIIKFRWFSCISTWDIPEITISKLSSKCLHLGRILIKQVRFLFLKLFVWCCRFIHPSVFMYLMRLSILELNDNLLVTLEPGTFSGLSQLKRLDLRYNHWTNLTTSTFDGLSQLENLDINSLKVLVLQPLTFMSLPKLVRLHMYGVPVVLTNNNVFRGMNSLTWLRMYNCSLSTLPPRFLEPLANIQSVDLSCNRFGYLGAYTFTSPANISKLSLARNNLSYIDRLAFTGLSGLKRLILTDCHLHQPLHLEHFAEWLTKLDMNRNAVSKCL